MLTRTPLSTHAEPFFPKGEILPSCNADSSQMVTWMPIAFMNALPAAATPDYASDMLHSFQALSRGRTGAKECAQRWPSRTPSPTGSYMSHSELSTSAESTPMPNHSSSSACSEVEDAFSSDLHDLREKQDVVVKNTFLNRESSDKLELSKLFRNQSAPNIVLSSPFELKAPTKLKLHARGNGRPCPYVFGTPGGCRQTSTCRFCHTCSPEEFENAFYARKAWMKARLDKSRKEFKQRKRQAWLAADSGCK